MCRIRSRRRDYVRLIRQSDIGLLMYDARSYHARHAGILGEYLSAGIPVIVPAGCWLAEQLVEPTQSYLDSLRTLPGSRDLKIEPAREPGDRPQRGEAETNFIISPGVGGPKSDEGDSRRRSSAEPAPESVSDIVLWFLWPQTAAPGSYLRVVLREFDAQATALQESVSVLARRGRGDQTGTLFHLHPNCIHFEVSWTNAYEDVPLPAQLIKVQGLPGSRAQCGSYPAAQVGLTAATVEQVPMLVEELCAHYSHYRESGRAHAGQWHRMHHPTRTLDALLARAGAASRRAVA